MGQYQTKQKVAIYECINDNKDAYFSIDKIVEDLKRKDINVGRTTVYRFIRNLVEQGKLNTFTNSKNSSTYYQVINTEDNPHIHFRCEKCDKILKIDCNEYNNFINHIEKSHSLNITGIKTVISGRCSVCLEN